MGKSHRDGSGESTDLVMKLKRIDCLCRTLAASERVDCVAACTRSMIEVHWDWSARRYLILCLWFWVRLGISGSARTNSSL
jgi:hypothetical protein